MGILRDGTTIEGTATIKTQVNCDKYNSRGTQMYIAAGESMSYLSGTAEAVYIAGESGVIIYSSSDNLASGLNHSATLLNTSGNTTFPGVLSADRVYNAVWNDLAEYFESDDPNNEANLVYVLNEKGNAILSSKRADSKVIGVCSDTAGYILKGELKDKGVLIALSGTVRVKYFGDIEIGDEVVSHIDGKAIRASQEEKVYKRDAIIGKVIKVLDEQLALIKV